MGLIATIFGGEDERNPRSPSFVSMVGARDPWDLDFPLISWGPYNDFSLRQALESLAIFGELGAAKTMGPLQHFCCGTWKSAWAAW